jgi:hypothetical protein
MGDNNGKTPFIPEALVDWLDARFPDRCPDPSDSDRAIWCKTGARQVVDMLRAISRQQVDEGPDAEIYQLLNR